MRHIPFQFDLYRLNVIDIGDNMSFSFMGNLIRTDADIKKILGAIADPSYDIPVTGSRYEYRWSARNYVDYAIESNQQFDVVWLTLARSTVKQIGRIVTDNSIVDGTSELYPPPADEMNVVFLLKRHLVAVEHTSPLIASDRWRRSFHEMAVKAAKKKQYVSTISIEPIPQKNEVLAAFRLFEKLTRLKVTLRIPNPDLSRKTEELFNLMKNGGIREFLQDMKNPNGLNKGEDALPFATAAMAQAGYKDGEVLMEGTIDRKRIETVRTGEKAARGKLDAMKDFARGALANAKAKETKKVIESIIVEAERLADEPEKAEG